MEAKGTRKVAAARTKLCLKLGNIPLEGRLVRMGKEADAELHQFSPAGNPIGYKKVDKVTGAEVATTDILKGKKIGDTVVTFTEDELDSAYASKQAEISKIKAEDIEDIPASYVKSVYAFKAENQTFLDLIGGRMVECRKQLRFVYVEGYQERTAILKFEGSAPMVYVLYFPSEVADTGTQPAPVCKPELTQTVDALLAGLSATVFVEPEEKKSVVIDQLVEAKLTGQPIIVKPSVKAAVVKGKSVEDLLKESIAMVNAK